MSRTETWKGRIRMVASPENAESFCRDYMIDHGKDELCSAYETWYEFMRDEYYNSFIYTDFGVFEKDLQDLSDEFGYICDIKDAGNGEYEILMQFYNGGTCLSEMVEEGLSSLNKKKKMTFVHLDDWIGCYVDGDLISEGHSMSIADAAMIMIKHGVSPSDMEDRYATDEFRKEMESVGNLPKKLEDCKLTKQ